MFKRLKEIVSNILVSKEIKNRKYPKKGEIWRLSPDDPWDAKSTVEILDVKEGWVRYRHINTGVAFQDERTKMPVFLYCYGFYKEH